MTRNALTNATNDRLATEYEEPRAKSLRPSETSNRGMLQLIERGGEAAAPTTPGAGISAHEPDDPRFTALDETRALSRSLARGIPQEECDALFAEHGYLVDKKMTEDFAPKDQARLAYVRWQLDRIEDARIGEGLDTLERLTELHEAISAEVAGFVEHVKAVSRPPRKKSR